MEKDWSNIFSQLCDLDFGLRHSAAIFNPSSNDSTQPLSYPDVQGRTADPENIATNPLSVSKDIGYPQISPSPKHKDSPDGREFRAMNDLKDKYSPPRHAYLQIGESTSSKAINASHLQILDIGDGSKYWRCTSRDCKPALAFPTVKDAVNHVRRKHLREKPFICIYCGASFARKQDALRHVSTMNRGKQYKCSVCNSAFSRKDYRDNHENICLSQAFDHLQK